MSDLKPVPCAICGAKAIRVESFTAWRFQCSLSARHGTSTPSLDPGEALKYWNDLQAEIAGYITARAAAEGPVIDREGNITHRGKLVSFNRMQSEIKSAFDAIDANLSAKGGSTTP